MLGWENLTQRQSRGHMIWKVMLKKMLSKILRAGEQKDRAVVQCLRSMLGRPYHQEGRTGNIGRIFKTLLSNSPELSGFGANWQT